MMKLKVYTYGLTLQWNCPIQTFSAVTGQVYGVWKHPDETCFMVMRRLPTEEYLEYYRDRRDELYLDKGLHYWLPQHHCYRHLEVEQYLDTIGDLREIEERG